MIPVQDCSEFQNPLVDHFTRPDPFTLVIFGATGDLASRKLFPALYGLERKCFLPQGFLVVGVGRRPKDTEGFREEIRQAVERFRPDDYQPQAWEAFAPRLFYHQADFSRRDDLHALRQRLEQLKASQGLPGNRLFYLATDPDAFAPIVTGLGEVGLCERPRFEPWARVVVEKPFGHDLASARDLDFQLHKVLREDQVYRIDHYLGKETIQNLLAFRFGNAIFEPLFHRTYVDHVQITMAETVGMEGRRGAFYDHAGALRDVLQNHLLQVLSLTAMEPPATLKAADLRDAKLKVLRNLQPLAGARVGQWVVRGQYGPGVVEGKKVRAYREEEAVRPDSTTETYVAVRLEIDNWRWAGVPFLLRTGKRLARRVTEVAVYFKLPPLQLFRTVECEGDFCDLTTTRPNVLAFRIQPQEGIALSFSTKRPGMSLDLHRVDFQFDYQQAFGKKLPEAYERLIWDALRGDASLYTRSDEVEAAWTFVNPILEQWQQEPPPTFPNYEAGSWGPREADRLTEGCLQGWRQP